MDWRWPGYKGVGTSITSLHEVTSIHVCIRVRDRILKYATWSVFFNTDGTTESPRTEIRRYGDSNQCERKVSLSRIEPEPEADRDLDTDTDTDATTEEWRHSFRLAY